MKKTFLKLVAITIMVAFIFSCKKDDPTPTTAPEEVVKPTNAKELNASEAQTEITESTKKFDASYASYSASVTTITNVINSLSSSSNAGIPSALAPSISSFRFDENDSDLLQDVANHFSNIDFLFGASKSGKKIPASFTEAEGVWEQNIETISGYNDAKSSEGEYAYYCGGKYYKISYKQTSTGGGKVVIKFSTKGIYSSGFGSNNCATTTGILASNAEYVISALETQEVIEKYCSNGIIRENKEKETTKITASLKIDNVEVMTYEFTSSYADGMRASATGKVKLAGKYEYTYTGKRSSTSYSYEYTWLDGTEKLHAAKFYAEYENMIDESANCTTIVGIRNKNQIENYKKIKKYNQSYTYGPFTIYSSTDYKGYISKVIEKYGSSIDENGFFKDTASFNKYDKDTTLSDTYFVVEIFKADGSAKIGKLIGRREKVTFGTGNSAYTYYETVWYIVYGDGKREKVKDRFKTSRIYYSVYNNLPSIFRSPSSSSSIEQK
ncbi:MAG: hypothetical protein NW207_08360 [Cytophagales bacterium]|nr:hypothetical protein [Cytophagales bacterium]